MTAQRPFLDRARPAAGRRAPRCWACSASTRRASARSALASLGADRLARTARHRRLALHRHEGRTTAGYQLVSDHHTLAAASGVHWYLGVDGISLSSWSLLTALLFPLAIILGATGANTRAYFAWMLLLEAAVMGSFLSLDLIVFFFYVRATLVPRTSSSPAGATSDGPTRRSSSSSTPSRLGLPVRRHPGAGLHPPVPDH